MVSSVSSAGFNVFYVLALNSEVDLPVFGLILQESRRGIYPVDAAVGVGVWALQDQPVIGHHGFSGSHVDEEYVWDDAAAADIVVFTSDWSGSVCDHRAAGHWGGKFSFLPT